MCERGVQLKLYNCTSAKHIERIVYFLLWVDVDLYDPANGQDTPPLLQTILTVRVNGIGKFWKCQRPVTMATSSHMTTRVVMMREIGTRVGAVGRGG